MNSHWLGVWKPRERHPYPQAEGMSAQDDDHLLAAMARPEAAPPAHLIYPVRQNFNPGFPLIREITPGFHTIARRGQIDRRFLRSEFYFGFVVFKICVYLKPVHGPLLSRAKIRKVDRLQSVHSIAQDRFDTTYNHFTVGVCQESSEGQSSRVDLRNVGAMEVVRSKSPIVSGNSCIDQSPDKANLCKHRMIYFSL